MKCSFCGNEKKPQDIKGKLMKRDLLVCKECFKKEFLCIYEKSD